MSAEQWHAHNAGYLGLALAWLRLRLAAAGGSDVDDETAVASEAVTAAEQSSPPPALALLAQAFELSRFEQDVILLCAAMELDTRMGGLCAQAHQDPHMPYPTFALAMSVFDEPNWAALAPTGALRSWRLVEQEPASRDPLTLRPLSIDERVVHFLKGLNVVDERLARLLRPVRSLSGPLPASQASTTDAITASVDHLSGRLVQLVGTSEASKRSVVNEVALRRRLLAYELPVASLPTSTVEADDLARLWRRESRLQPIALLLTSDREALTAAQARAGRLLVEEQDASVFLSVADVCGDLADVSTIHDVRTPTAGEQRDLWTEALGSELLDIAGQLAAEFDLDASEIERVADEAKRVGIGDLAEGAWLRGKSLSRPHLDALAERIRPVATWDDIVLSDEPTRLLRSLACKARHRGQVYDAWGFGATVRHAASASARCSPARAEPARRWRPRSSPTTSGSTCTASTCPASSASTSARRRRTCAACSTPPSRAAPCCSSTRPTRCSASAARSRTAMTATPTSRSTTCSSGWSAYRGLAILATNMQSALDSAFLRRLRFIVPFALPSRSERERIWRQVFPPEVPVDGIDPARLGRLSLSGALIHSIALHASFSAAAAGTPVTMGLVLDATRVELRKADRSTNEVEAV